MDDNENADLKWQKRNFYLRIGIIAILLLIGVAILYNHYGYKDPKNEWLSDAYGKKVVSCEQALWYYAKNVLHYDKDVNIQMPDNLITINITDKG